MATVKQGALLYGGGERRRRATASDACGDLWLGFAPEDVATWAVDAGLSEGESLYLALRNGFRVQLRVFQKLQEKEQP